MDGVIFNIQRFCMDDGPGIRTTVFLKGCPLKCDWCHNPESQSIKPEFMFYKERCSGCGRCAEITVDDKNFICGNGAKELCGKIVSADEVMTEVLKDKVFYDNSGGGMTLSGGEPLYQYDFALELLKKAKENNIHTAVETCGYTNRSLSEMCKYVDIWLYDIKLLDADLHKKHMGATNEIILKNLKFLVKSGAEVILRCPVIPQVNMNDEHFEALACLVNDLKNVRAIHIEPYHPLGIAKSQQLGREQRYANEHYLEKSEVVPFADKLKNETNVDVFLL